MPLLCGSQLYLLCTKLARNSTQHFGNALYGLNVCPLLFGVQAVPLGTPKEDGDIFGRQESAVRPKRLSDELRLPP